MLVEKWAIDRPKPYPKNARKWSARAVDTLASSIREYGFRQPIVVDSDDVIIIGHLRLAAAKQLGLQEVPVHVARELSPEQVKGLRLMDNRSHQESDWDLALLAPEIADLSALAFDLSLTGFDARELDGLLATEGDDKADSAPPLPEVAASRPGDLWLLGTHRLLCGDSTRQEAVARLCGPALADLVFTDPPYNVNYEGYTEDKLTIQGDRMTPEDFRQFLTAAFSCYRSVLKPGASLYVCHASSVQREFQNALEAAGFEMRCQIIWAKNTFAWGFGRYKFQHEPIFYCHVAGQSDAWYGDKSQSTLWQENKPAANRMHPTMKPVELIERALLNSSKAGDVIVDLFGGSGSTLIGCERRGRQALLMEIDPRYADVIVNRWQEFAGKQATLEADGRTFNEIRSERLAVAA
jgi:DNA modification methylase